MGASAGGRAAESEFVSMFTREAPRVRALARRLCGDSDADDLVQETFLAAFRSFDQLQDRDHPRPWLYAIAHRACSRMHRRRSGEPARLESLDDLLPRPTATVPDLGALDADPHRERLRTEAREIVERGLAQLPETFRVPLLLADIAELKLGEIATILGVREATVKTRVHRARLKLREILASELPQRPAPASNHARTACLDLLRARLSALDHGVAFPFAATSLCERCQALLGTLDLAVSTCRDLQEENISPDLRRRILEAGRTTFGR